MSFLPNDYFRWFFSTFLQKCGENLEKCSYSIELQFEYTFTKVWGKGESSCDIIELVENHVEVKSLWRPIFLRKVFFASSPFFLKTSSVNRSVKKFFQMLHNFKIFLRFKNFMSFENNLLVPSYMMMDEEAWPQRMVHFWRIPLASALDFVCTFLVLSVCTCLVAKMSQISSSLISSASSANSDWLVHGQDSWRQVRSLALFRRFFIFHTIEVFLF